METAGKISDFLFEKISSELPGILWKMGLEKITANDFIHGYISDLTKNQVAVYGLEGKETPESGMYSTAVHLYLPGQDDPGPYLRGMGRFFDSIEIERAGVLWEELEYQVEYPGELSGGGAGSSVLFIITVREDFDI